MITQKKQKMEKLNYKSVMLLFLPLVLVSFTLSAQEVTKEFHKEFTTSANTTLQISNRYGDVVIRNWDKDQVVIEVKVTVEMPNREKAEKLLSYIDIQFSEGDNLISAKTVIDDKLNFTGWGSGSSKYSREYNVKMPVGQA